MPILRNPDTRVARLAPRPSPATPSGGAGAARAATAASPPTSATTRVRSTSASATARASPSTAPSCSPGLERAAIKRPVEREQLEALVDRIVAELQAEGGTPEADDVGELALRGLKELDRVAYVRFASVYRKFEDVDQFEAELARLEPEPPLQREHLFDTSVPSDPEIKLRSYPR